MTGRLESKVAIITGAGTGIGEAIAHKFAREGARVIISGLPDDPIEDVARSIRENGGDAIPKAGAYRMKTQPGPASSWRSPVSNASIF